MAEYEYDYYNGNAGRLPHEADEAWGVMISAALKEHEGQEKAP
ncbi:hypothetical protein [Rhizobium hidalgonense]|nr:hypothetical protein [Rhizobium hidalgonense]MDR9813126.1 hypothetical protein [Rhizobium hidalgonense]